ncbi:hypothetical protein [Parvimonas micra]|uniref:hypothetical protein n=1 Tax=Parvimonas micra TaxID=33033 RepID=UPI00123BE572|nr:hypothetical protein [Parvimonas micra]
MAEKNVENYYSKHIFMANFRLKKDKNSKNKNVNDIVFDNDVWKKYSIDDVKNVGEFVDNYANYNYFNEQARDLIFYKENKSKVVSYKFEHIDSSENSEYIIDINDVNERKTYELNLDKIILKEYEIINKKSYLMMIYVTNNKYGDISDIKNINQYGRRLFSPWIPLDLGNGANTECPDDLQIHIGKDKIYSNYENSGKADLNYKDKEIFKYNFDDKNKYKSYSERLNFIRQKEVNDKNDKSIIDNRRESYLIRNILNYKKESKDEKIEIELINPDRMYVGFYLKNNSLIERIKKYSTEKQEYLTEKQEYAYLYDDSLSDQLYALAYIDGEDATCQSRVMRKKLLQETIYDRWIDWGTIHTVTHNGFGCIATDGAPYESVIMPFLTEYMEMMALVLLQRNLLLEFHIEAKKLSPEFNSEKLENLQKDYVKFKTQVLLFEVTPQEQGYEIYRLMQKQLYIDEEKEKLDDIMNSLYEVANVKHSIELNIIMNRLTIIAILIALVSFAISVLDI